MIQEVYVSEGFSGSGRHIVDEVCEGSGIRPEIFSERVFAYVSDTQHPQGVMCVVRQRGQKEDLGETLTKNVRKMEKPLFLLLDHLQDPGNLGTIFRTAEAAGVTGIILSQDCADIYNPKTIRSTMGSVFRMPFWYVRDIKEAIHVLKQKSIRIYAAHLCGAMFYDEADYLGASAFLIGNEGNGLQDEIASLADDYIQIPMEGEVESLNAAVAAAILMFEARKQRRR